MVCGLGLPWRLQPHHEIALIYGTTRLARPNSLTFHARFTPDCLLTLKGKEREIQTERLTRHEAHHGNPSAINNLAVMILLGFGQTYRCAKLQHEEEIRAIETHAPHMLQYKADFLDDAENAFDPTLDLSPYWHPRDPVRNFHEAMPLFELAADKQSLMAQYNVKLLRLMEFRGEFHDTLKLNPYKVWEKSLRNAWEDLDAFRITTLKRLLALLNFPPQCQTQAGAQVDLRTAAIDSEVMQWYNVYHAVETSSLLHHTLRKGDIHKTNKVTESCTTWPYSLAIEEPLITHLSSPFALRLWSKWSRARSDINGTFWGICDQYRSLKACVDWWNDGWAMYELATMAERSDPRTMTLLIQSCQKADSEPHTAKNRSEAAVKHLIGALDAHYLSLFQVTKAGSGAVIQEAQYEYLLEQAQILGCPLAQSLTAQKLLADDNYMPREDREKILVLVQHAAEQGELWTQSYLAHQIPLANVWSKRAAALGYAFALCQLARDNLDRHWIMNPLWRGARFGWSEDGLPICDSAAYIAATLAADRDPDQPIGRVMTLLMDSKRHDWESKLSIVAGMLLPEFHLLKTKELNHSRSQNQHEEHIALRTWHLRHRVSLDARKAVDELDHTWIMPTDEKHDAYVQWTGANRWVPIKAFGVTDVRADGGFKWFHRWYSWMKGHFRQASFGAILERIRNEVSRTQVRYVTVPSVYD